MLIPRSLARKLEKSRKSILLLGPRQSGKSTLIQTLQPEMTINLADEQTFLSFAGNPAELEQRLKGKSYRSIFIDEIQRLPSLLNTIQAIIDQRGHAVRFFLTGSSARKLKRGRANLLPGRVHVYHLGPFSFGELNHLFHVDRALETGLLPGIYLEESEEERIKTLRSYAATYLKEEIQAEALTRNLEGFSRFLFSASHWAGKFMDISKVAAESSVSRASVMRYFEILEDTLIVRRCPPFSRSLRRRLIQHPKFYFFDNGVLNALLGNFKASSDRRGLLFEHLFFNQLIHSAMHADVDISVSTYRTEHGAEVDFIVERGQKVWAIELKSSADIKKIDIRGFQSFAEYYRKPHRQCVAYLGTIQKEINGIPVVPWMQVLELLGIS